MKKFTLKLFSYIMAALIIVGTVPFAASAENEKIIAAVKTDKKREITLMMYIFMQISVQNILLYYHIINTIALSIEKRRKITES